MKRKNYDSYGEGRGIRKSSKIIIFVIMIFLTCFFLFPIFVIAMNSLKGQLFISKAPFALPNAETFAGLTNYLSGVGKIGFFQAFGYSTWITVSSVAVIVICTSMTAWFITRVKGRFTSGLYYLFVFAMIVPFQMVMFTLSKAANMLRLDGPVGIIVIYLGFGAGMSVFMFSGFVKSIPIALEESAMLDGCNPIQTFFKIVLPILKPMTVTVAILNTMWIWNDYLLPYLILGTKYKTIPIAVQYLRGGYGSIDMGAMMAMLVLSILPVVIFYLVCQKYIIKGVVAGAVKG